MSEENADFRKYKTTCNTLNRDRIFMQKRYFNFSNLESIKITKNTALKPTKTVHDTVYLDRFFLDGTFKIMMLKPTSLVKKN